MIRLRRPSDRLTFGIDGATLCQDSRRLEHSAADSDVRGGVGVISQCKLFLERFLEVLFFRRFALVGEMARSEAAAEPLLTRGRISFAREGTISSAGCRFAL